MHQYIEEKTSLKGLVFLYNSSKKTNNYYKGKKLGV